MNKFLIIWFLAFSICANGKEEHFFHAITYDFSGGRFGDNLLSYLHAKWLSHRYGVLLLYKPFKYSSDLALHEKETKFEFNYFRNRIRTDVSNIGSDLNNLRPVLFVCPYFPEDPIEREEDHYAFFDVNWKDKEFRKIALEAIAPQKTLRLIEPSQDTVNLAIHIRMGDNYDDDAFRIRFPLKLPPLSFYLDALSKVLEYFPGKKIYCHIFTDAAQPERLVETMKSAVPPGFSVKFAYRRGLSLPNFNVLEDFFSLFNFDALIRSQSHFSMVPSLLHDYAILCYPSNFTREGARPAITKIEIQVDEILYDRLMREK